MYQGLGETYIKVFCWLTAWSFVGAAVICLIPRLFKRFSRGWCLLGTVILGAVFAYFSNVKFHREMFAQEHQRHNLLVPNTGCVRYEPSFGHLYAEYEMTLAEFNEWVTRHPWKLVEYDRAFIQHDAKRLGFADPSLAFATEMAADGGQLRVYFEDGKMYLSYNVM